ncbi:hypothetical protein ACWEOZ_32830 [Actinoplanes sp. NPDC004185]
MPPTEQQIQAAIQALRKDAATWAAGKDKLVDAAAVAARLELSALHFSYLGDQFGLSEVYQQLQQRLYTLLNEGAANFLALSAALSDAADGYEQDEINAVHRLTGIY